jgi:hypothetical protein
MEKRLLHAFANFKAKKKKSGVELDQMLVKASGICQEESAPSHELSVAMAENAGLVLRRARTRIEDTEFLDGVFMLLTSCLETDKRNTLKIMSEVTIPMYQHVLGKVDSATNSGKNAVKEYLLNAMDIVGLHFGKYLGKCNNAPDFLISSLEEIYLKNVMIVVNCDFKSEENIIVKRCLETLIDLNLHFQSVNVRFAESKCRRIKNIFTKKNDFRAPGTFGQQKVCADFFDEYDLQKLHYEFLATLFCKPNGSKTKPSKVQNLDPHPLTDKYAKAYRTLLDPNFQTFLDHVETVVKDQGDEPYMDLLVDLVLTQTQKANLFTRKRALNSLVDQSGIQAFRCFSVQIVSAHLQVEKRLTVPPKDVLIHFDSFAITSDDNGKIISCPTANVGEFSFDLHPMPSSGLMSQSTPSKTPLCLTIDAQPHDSLCIMGNEIDCGEEKVTFRMFLDARGKHREAESVLKRLLPSPSNPRAKRATTEWLALPEKQTIPKVNSLPPKPVDNQPAISDKASNSSNRSAASERRPKKKTASTCNPKERIHMRKEPAKLKPSAKKANDSSPLEGQSVRKSTRSKSLSSVTYVDRGSSQEDECYMSDVSVDGNMRNQDSKRTGRPQSGKKNSQTLSNSKADSRKKSLKDKPKKAIGSRLSHSSRKSAEKTKVPKASLKHVNVGKRTSSRKKMTVQSPPVVEGNDTDVDSPSDFSEELKLSDLELFSSDDQVVRHVVSESKAKAKKPKASRRAATALPKKDSHAAKHGKAARKLVKPKRKKEMIPKPVSEKAISSDDADVTTEEDVPSASSDIGSDKELTDDEFDGDSENSGDELEKTRTQSYRKRMSPKKKKKSKPKRKQASRKSTPSNDIEEEIADDADEMHTVMSKAITQFSKHGKTKSEAFAKQLAKRRMTKILKEKSRIIKEIEEEISAKQSESETALNKHLEKIDKVKKEVQETNGSIDELCERLEAQKNELKLLLKQVPVIKKQVRKVQSALENKGKAHKRKFLDICDEAVAEESKKFKARMISEKKAKKKMMNSMMRMLQDSFSC